MDQSSILVGRGAVNVRMHVMFWFIYDIDTV